MINKVLGALNPIKGIIQAFTGNAENKRELLGALAKAEVSLVTSALDYEKERLAALQKIIVAEAQSSNWLTSNWRPLTMLTFVALVVGTWLGLSPEDLPDELILELFSLIKLGLGGYVIGRSAEKIVKTVAPVVAELKLRRKKD